MNENVWAKVDWFARIDVADLEEDDFIIFKQDGVLSPFDMIIPFDAD
jgi:hypothetical protein